MVFNTYSFTHPILHPLSALLAVLAYFSHVRYFKFYTHLPSYNNDILNYYAIQLLLFSVVSHFIIVFLLKKYLSALILAIILAVCLFIKNTLYKKTISLLRKKFGPLCFSNYVKKSVTNNFYKLLTQ